MEKKFKYWVFFQALLLTVVVFVIGMYLGVVVEEGRASEIDSYYTDSEVMLLDILTISEIINAGDYSCEVLTQANFDLVNGVYDQAVLLEEYEKSDLITDGIKSLHKKYDVLRTFIWSNFINLKEDCNEDFSTVVYLYEYETEDLSKKATQSVWSKVLLELKQNEDENIVLIPIAGDSGLNSLNVLMDKYGIESLPAVLIDEEVVLYEISSPGELSVYLK